MFKKISAKEYHYCDIFLKPKFTTVSSRKECDTKVTFGGKSFDLPIYPANMKSVVNIQTCEFFATNNLFYTMHRFGIDQIKFLDYMKSKNLFTSISVGVNEDTISQLELIKKTNLEPDYITIDIANAWCIKSKNMISYIKNNFNSFLIVGNIASKEAAMEIHKWGADAIKVGIAGGRVCITKDKTGFHRPMVSTILECASYTNEVKIPLIADGGITVHGDIAKAIACGADMIMAGSLFAGYDESAGEIIEININGHDRTYKEYYGSASQYNKNEYINIEGKKILIDYHGSMSKLLKEIKEDLQSAISYSGGNKLYDLKSCELIATS